MPWSLQPKLKEKTVKTGRGGAEGIKPASAFKAGNTLLCIPFDVNRAPRGHEVSGSSSQPKELQKKHRLSFLSGDDDGGLVLIGKTGRGGLGSTTGRKASSSKVPKIGVRRPTSVVGGLDLLGGNERYSLRASASLYTLADTDTDEADMSHYITPFILSDYDASIPSLSSSSSFPSPPSSASIRTQSSLSSSGPLFPSFSYLSASSATTHSQSSLRGSIKSVPSRLHLDLPPKLELPEKWLTSPLDRSLSSSGWLASPDRDSYEKEK